jgi:hypothetical protein
MHLVVVVQFMVVQIHKHVIMMPMPIQMMVHVGHKMIVMLISVSQKTLMESKMEVDLLHHYLILQLGQVQTLMTH